VENKQCSKRYYLNSYRHLNTKLLRLNNDKTFNEVIEKGDPWDDVSHCNSRQVATKNEGSGPFNGHRCHVAHQIIWSWYTGC